MKPFPKHRDGIEPGKHIVRATNKYGTELRQCYSHWCIIKETEEGEPNNVFHVGQRKYIQRLWNEQFADSKFYDPQNYRYGRKYNQ